MIVRESALFRSGRVPSCPVITNDPSGGIKSVPPPVISPLLHNRFVIVTAPEPAMAPPSSQHSRIRAEALKFNVGDCPWEKGKLTISSLGSMGLVVRRVDGGLSVKPMNRSVPSPLREQLRAMKAVCVSSS